MTDITLPKLNQTGTNEWADVQDDVIAIRDVVNGNLDNDNLSGAAAISAANLASHVVEAGGLNTATTRRDYAEVLTEQTTTSTTWADLTTPGPSVAVTVPSGGLAMVFASVELKHSAGALASSYVGLSEATDFAISGAAGSDNGAIISTNSTSYVVALTSPGETAGTVPTGLTRAVVGGWIIPGIPTAGARTYKLVYGTTSGTATFKNRKLWVAVTGGF